MYDDEFDLIQYLEHDIRLLLMGEKIPHNKGGHFPFCKSQLDSRMFGVVGPTGL
jgi:hypothetical protein